LEEKTDQEDVGSDVSARGIPASQGIVGGVASIYDVTVNRIDIMIVSFFPSSQRSARLLI
jgi:hypothetical protein